MTDVTHEQEIVGYGCVCGRSKKSRVVICGAPGRLRHYLSTCSGSACSATALLYSLAEYETFLNEVSPLHYFLSHFHPPSIRKYRGAKRNVVQL